MQFIRKENLRHGMVLNEAWINYGLVSGNSYFHIRLPLFVLRPFFSGFEDEELHWYNPCIMFQYDKYRREFVVRWGFRGHSKFMPELTEEKPFYAYQGKEQLV